MQPGEVWRLYDRDVDPPAAKLHILVVPAMRWTLRINSRPFWPPHHFLRSRPGNGLDHDSWVELNTVLEQRQRDMDTARYLGRLSPHQLAALADAIAAADTLTPDQKEIIARSLA